MPSLDFETISYTVSDILVNFSRQTYERGQLYARQGRVRGIKFIDAGRLVADVQGSSRKPYKVEVRIADLRGKKTFNGTCSCPVSEDCKHVVAALIEGIKQFPSYRNSFNTSPGKIIDVTPTQKVTEPEPLNSSPRINNSERIEGLDNSLLSWLDGLNQAVKPDIGKPAKAVNTTAQKVLIYVIRPSNGAEAFSITPMTTSLLKSGAFSSHRKNYRIDMIESYNRAKHVQDHDVVVLRLIYALVPYSERYGSSFTIQGGEEGVMLLKLLIETGRCYPEGETNPQNYLTMGETKNGFIRWKIDQGGGQTTYVNIEGTEIDAAPFILKLRPLYYLCLLTKTVGILNTRIPYDQVISLLNAPRINHEQCAVINQKLAGILGNDDNRVLPAILPIRQVTVKPIPVLNLGVTVVNAQKSGSWIRSMGEDISLPIANLSFAYAGQLTAYHDAKTEISLYKEGEVSVLQRDKAAEAETIRQLRQYGLTLILGDLRRYYHIRPEHNFYLTIGQQKENFHADKILATLWTNFMQEQLPILKELGWDIRVDPSFPYNIVHAENEWYAEVEESSGIDWFSVELGVYIEGKKFNLVPILLDLLKKERDILTIIDKLPPKKPLLVSMEDGRRLALPSERAKILLSTLQHLFSFHENIDKAGKLKLRSLDAALLAEIEAAGAALNMRWHGGDKIRSLGKKLKDFKSIKKISPPANFSGELRTYQQDGLNWLQFLREYNLAGILADDMGLGKTVQALAHIATEKAAKRLNQPVLVIATTSLMVNWKMEISRFVPGLNTLVLHGANRKAQFKDIKEFDLILTTYPLLPRDKDQLLVFEYHTLILDEAQNIKNANTKITQIVNQIKAQHRICMTGTPLENHLGELWSLFNFLLPGYLGNKQQFGHLFRIPIEKDGNIERGASLMRRIKPFVLRRTKQEVVTELPPKTEIVRMVELEGAQRDLYETIRIAMYNRVTEEISAKGMDKSHIIVLDALLKLRQVCCDPALLKIEAAKNINESAKLRELLNMLTAMIEEGRKILVFSQFTGMLELIEKKLKGLEIPYVKLTGQTNDRETPIRSFQEGKVPLFLISLKAGGVGLNLTAADTVIHYDPWWNPAVENQATDRAYRIGQDKPVFVYKIITTGTVEEKIIEMQVKKRRLMDSLFDPAAKTSVKLSAGDIKALFEPLT